MSWLYALTRLFSGPKPLPEASEPPPPGHNRLHLFAGNFGSELEATKYVFDAPDANHPEPFTNDLPDAYVDTAFVEIAHGDRLEPALELITNDTVDIGHADTLIIVSERAFGGFPFALNDTPRARYLGMWEIRT